MLALHSDEENIADTQHDPLHDGDKSKNAVASKIGLVSLHVFEAREPPPRGVHIRQSNEEDISGAHSRKKIVSCGRHATADLTEHVLRIIKRSVKRIHVARQIGCSA